MGSLRTRVLVTAVAVSAVLGTAGQAAAAPPTTSVSAARPSDLFPLLKQAQLVAGDTWRTKARTKGFREVKLQIKTGSGPFRTVKTYRVPKNGKVKIARTFPKPGGYQVRTVAVAAGAGRDVKSKAVLITVVPRQYQGTFGGTHTSGTSWNGNLTFLYQERDPVTNQRWDDGAIHYTGIEGSLSWSFDASVLNGSQRRNCSAAPSTGQIDVDSLSTFIQVQRTFEKTKGYRYRLDVTAPESPRIQYTCEYLRGDTWEQETRDYSLQFGPNLGDLLTNSLSVEATGVGGQYASSLSAALVGDINRPGEAITNRWYWNFAVA